MNKATKSLTLYLSASVARFPTSDASLLAPAYHPKLPKFLHVFTRMWVHMRVHVKARGSCQVLSSITLD